MPDLNGKSREELILEVRALRRMLAEAGNNPPKPGPGRNFEHFQMLVESMSEGLAIRDNAGRLQYVNKRFCAMLGREPGEIIGHKMAEFLHPEDPSRAVPPENAPANSPLGHDTVWKGRDGEPVYALAAPSPILDDNGEEMGEFAVYTDITLRTQMEEELERERTLLRTLVDQIPDAIYVKDTLGRYVLVNNAQLRLMGAASLEEIIGKTAEDFFPESQAKRVRQSDATVLRNGAATYNQAERLQTQSGRVRWLLESRVPLRTRGGELSGIIGIRRDVTEERETQSTLAAHFENSGQILEHSRDIAYRIDLPLNAYTYVSPAVKNLTGLSPHEVMDLGPSGLQERVHPEDLQLVEGHARRLIACARGDQEAPLAEYRIRHVNGEYRWCSESASVLLDEEGEPAMRIGTLRDITEDKRAQEAMRAASRMEATATLAGGIAHSFNNLMAVVLGNAELLRIKTPEGDKAARLLDAIAHAAEEAGKLAKEMLAFARGGQYRATAVDLNETVLTVLRLGKRSLPSNIETETDLQADLHSVYGDQTQLSQVLTNLCINAAEAMPSGGKITIVTRNRTVTSEDAALRPGLVPGAYACVSVRDTGVGMEKETKGRVFEPFFTTKFQGRGLGLAAAYGITKNHGGYIGVDSAPGLGTVFEVYLPASGKHVLHHPEETRSTALATATVMVVDDEAAFVRLTQQLLEKVGYHVLTAADGREALMLAQRHGNAIRAVILDMAMPVMGGEVAFPLLRDALPGAKIILCSGHELGAAARGLLEQGAIAYLQKPFRATALTAAIRSALGD